MKKMIWNQKLPLKNNGELELFFIGTGSAFSKTMNQTNFFIIKGDTHIMIDFGMTAPRALYETAKLEVTDVEVLLPTHSHADHVGGIEALALMNRYIGRKFLNKSKLTMIISEDYQRVLWTHTLQGGLEWNEKGVDASEKLQFSDFFKAVRPKWKAHQPREIFKLDMNGIHLELFRTNHIPEQAENWEASFISYGLFIDGRVFISGDTQFDPDLIYMYADRSEVMFHDVQFFPGAVHAPLEDLKTLPPEIKRKMYLFHYSDDWKKQDIKDFGGWCEQGVRYIF